MRFVPSGLVSAIPGVSFQSRAIGVLHPANNASSRSLYRPEQPGRISIMPPSPSDSWQVRHPVSAGADVRFPKARAWNFNAPEGVADSLQVSSYKIDPLIRARNLLAKDRVRSLVFNVPEPMGPKVPLVSKPFSFACAGERLAVMDNSSVCAITLIFVNADIEDPRHTRWLNSSHEFPSIAAINHR